MKPRHTHDCNTCRFLGMFGKYDLWYCSPKKFGGSLICRYGSDGPEYASIPFDIFTDQLEKRSRPQFIDNSLKYIACYLLSRHKWKPLDIKKIDCLTETFILNFKNFSIHLTDESKVISLAEIYTNNKFVFVYGLAQLRFFYLDNNFLRSGRIVSKEFFDQAVNLETAEDRMVLFDRFEERNLNASNC